MRRKIKINFDLSTNNYFNLIKTVFLHPIIFANQIPLTKNLIKPTSFFLINLLLGYFIGAVLGQVLNPNHPSIFFALSQLILMAPLFLIGLFLFSLGIWAIAKVLGGKASIKQTIGIICFASLPLVFLYIPLLGLISILINLAILIISLANINQFPKFLSFVTLSLPFLILLILATIVGVTSNLTFIYFLPGLNFLNLGI